MPRKREEFTLSDLIALLKTTPAWVGPVLAVAAFLFLRFVIRLLLPTSAREADLAAIWRALLSMLAWGLSGAVLLAWGIAEIWKLSNRRLLDQQGGIESIRGLSWWEFERLVSEAYRRKGCAVEVVGSTSGDGGVDIRLSKPGERVLVQCKQWKAYKVGVTTIREMLGVVVSEKATKGIVVTSGQFTREARQFAQANPQIELVDGSALAILIRGVQTAPVAPLPVISTLRPTSVRCPACGAEMVLRTARKGQNAGGQFWGCSKYPACRGIRQFAAAREGSENP